MSDTRHSTTGCLDAETLAAFLDGRLEPRARAAVETHLAECEDCYEVWMESRDVAGSAVSSKTGGVGRRTIVWFGVAATVAFAVTASLLMRSTGIRPELDALATGLQGTRLTTARVVGDFDWAEAPAPTRSAGTDSVRLPPDADVALARLRQAVERDRTAANLAALGAGFAAVGASVEAIEVLEEAVAMNDTLAFAWSDLAGALIERSSAPGRNIDVPRAVVAAERATALRPGLPPALFNLALAREALGQADEAIDAWERYLQLDKGSPWATEARARVEALRKRRPEAPFDTQATRDRFFDGLLADWAHGDATDDEVTATIGTLATPEDQLVENTWDHARRLRSGSRLRFGQLVSGLTGYREARRAYTATDFETAHRIFGRAEAMLTQAGSPMAPLATVHRSIIAGRMGDPRSSARLALAALSATAAAPAAVVRAQAEAQLGSLAASDTRRLESLAHYERARTAFAAAGELERAAFVDGLMATQYERLGDLTRAWDTRVRALRGSAREGTWLAGAENALNLGWLPVAESLAAGAERIARQHDRRAMLADALRMLAMVRGLRGDYKAATRARLDGELVASGLTGATRDRLDAELAVAQAEIEALPGGDVSAGLAASDRAHQYFVATAATSRRPLVHLARGRLFESVGRRSEARVELVTGLGLYQQARQHITSHVGQAQFSDVARRLGVRLAELEIAEGRYREALVAFEWSRIHDRRWDDEPPSIGPLPGGHQVVAFLVTDARTYGWMLRGPDIHFFTVEATRDQLRLLAGAASAPRFDRNRSGQLRKLLFDPVTDLLDPAAPLILVADGLLHTVPFAGLPGRTADYFVEEWATLLAPSVATAVSMPAAPDIHPENALIVGNPWFDAAVFPGLAPLPGAAEEAGRIAALYGARALVGTAVRSDFTRRAPTARLIHFAGHALVNAHQAGDSVLVAGDALAEGVRAAEVSSWRLRGAPLVVLSACHGTGGIATESAGPVGLALSFLSAGASAVIASHWLVNDRTAQQIMVRFHTAIRQGIPMARALQQAQLASLRETGTSVPDWAGFVAFSAGTTTDSGS